VNQPANPMTSSNSRHFFTQKLRWRNLVSQKLLVNAIIAKYMEYGHTKSFCGYPARCGGHHLSADYPNTRDSPPKCALCSSDHPSSYKRCSIYKDLQRRKNPKSSNHLSNNFSSKNTYVQDTHTVEAMQLLESTPIYAQATSNSHSNHTVPSLSPDMNKTMLTFIDEFKQLINLLIVLLTKVISKLLDLK